MTSWGSICETLKYCSRSKHADSKTFEMKKVYAFDIYTDITRVTMLMILENFECFCENMKKKSTVRKNHKHNLTPSHPFVSLRALSLRKRKKNEKMERNLVGNDFVNNEFDFDKRV
jgi:thioredoxin-related protein